jgi:hypothetical protein
MIGLGLGLLLAIFLSFGCLIAAFNSLMSIRESYDSESRGMAILGFFGGIIGSAFFGWLTIILLNHLESMQGILLR